MQLAHRRAANVIRSALLSERITSAIFRATLREIPPLERDGWLDLLWDVGEVPDDSPELPRGCVPYVPCPVATVLETVQGASVTCDDVFVDVGSGTGRTAFLANLLTGVNCIGLEIQPGLVEAARVRARRLHLHRVRFVEGDAAELIRFIELGSVFFFYCPFDQERVDRVLADLEGIARTRQIRICCVQMPVIERPWLIRLPSTCVELDIYRSTLPHDQADPAPGGSKSDTTPG